MSFPKSEGKAATVAKSGVKEGATTISAKTDQPRPQRSKTPSSPIMKFSTQEEAKLAAAMKREGSVFNEIRRSRLQASPTGFGSTFFQALENSLSNNSAEQSQMEFKLPHFIGYRQVKRKSHKFRTVSEELMLVLYFGERGQGGAQEFPRLQAPL